MTSIQKMREGRGLRNDLTRQEKISIVRYLMSAGYELGNLDMSEEWGWDGCTMAGRLRTEWGLSSDTIDTPYPDAESPFGQKARPTDAVR